MRDERDEREIATMRDERDDARRCAKSRPATKLHFKAPPVGGAFCLDSVNAVRTHLCRIICTFLEARTHLCQIICIYRAKNITYSPKKHSKRRYSEKNRTFEGQFCRISDFAVFSKRQK